MEHVPQGDNMANIRDVAKEAGVGIATVSRYINSDGYVSTQVSAKIQKAIEKLNYKPNALARAVFTKSSMMIGLIIPSIVNPFYPELAVSIEARAREKGYSIVLSNTEYISKNEKSIIEMLEQHRVDGIITANAKCISEYNNTNLPVVSVEKSISTDITYITADNYAGGKLVADYIIERSLKKVLYIKGPNSINIAKERSKGFLETMEKNNKSVDVIEAVYGEDIVNIGDRLHLYDMIFVWNDDLAISVLSACYQSGLRVPNDIEVIGFDDIFYSKKTSPPLTTVSVPIIALGEAAVDLLIDQIENKKVSADGHILDVELVFRNSTKESGE